MSRSATVGLILCAAAAVGQEPTPELAPFPLEIIRTSPDCTKEDREVLQKLWPMMLRAADASVPDSAKLSAALGNLGRQDCNREDACLAQLGQLAGSLYAFYAQVDFDLDGNVVASGRVVRDDGKAVRELKTVKVPKANGAFRDTAQVALKQLLVVLDVAQLSPFRPQEPEVGVKPAPIAVPQPVPIAMPQPARAPEPLTTSVTRSPLRMPALAGIGAGAACLVVGGVLFATAGTARTDVSQGVVRVWSEDATKVASIQRSQTAGVVLLSVGAGLAAAGAGLYLFGPQETTTTLVPLNGGAAVMMTGRLP